MILVSVIRRLAGSSGVSVVGGTRASGTRALGGVSVVGGLACSGGPSLSWTRASWLACTGGMRGRLRAFAVLRAATTLRTLGTATDRG